MKEAEAERVACVARVLADVVSLRVVSVLAIDVDLTADELSEALSLPATQVLSALDRMVELGGVIAKTQGRYRLVRADLAELVRQLGR